MNCKYDFNRRYIKNRKKTKKKKKDMNITKISKYKKTEQHLYEGTQNRHEHY